MFKCNACMVALGSKMQKNTPLIETGYNQYGCKASLYTAKDGRHYLKIDDNKSGKPDQSFMWLTEWDFKNVYLPAMKQQYLVEHHRFPKCWKID